MGRLEVQKQVMALQTRLRFDEPGVDDNAVDTPLTEMQRLFVEEYVLDPTSATAAAIRAGFAEGSAATKASEMLAMPKIASAIARELVQREDRTQVTKDRVLNEIAILAFSDITNFVYDEDGRVSVKEGVPEFALRAIQSVKCKRRTIPRKDDEPIYEVEVEIKLWSKTDSLRMAGQHLAMFVDRVRPEDPDGRPVGTAITEQVESALISLHSRLDQLQARHKMRAIAEASGGTPAP